MARIRQELAAGQKGDQKALSRLRCVDKVTVSDWKAALEVAEAIKDEVRISELQHFQPSHATVIARAFRKRYGKDWPTTVNGEVAALVERCEAEALTVKDLRQLLLPGTPPGAGETCTIADLAELASRGILYGTVYADPPWKYGNQASWASTDDHYPTLTVEEIAALPVAALAAGEAHLHLWTTNAFLPDAFAVLRAWGFAYKSAFVWVKPQVGLGNYWRVSHEFLLLGVRGECPFRDRSLRSWLEADRGRHSTKPDPVRLLIEKASPGPRLELFGRRQAEGWTVWGNQVERDLLYKG
jgi:N6-adenosine-specific RNA methylase IME4